MRVKIGGTWFDSKNEPIVIQFDHDEQQAIKNWDWKRSPKGKFLIAPPEYKSKDVEEIEKLIR